MLWATDPLWGTLGHCLSVCLVVSSWYKKNVVTPLALLSWCGPKMYENYTLFFFSKLEKFIVIIYTMPFQTKI